MHKMKKEVLEENERKTSSHPFQNAKLFPFTLVHCDSCIKILEENKFILFHNQKLLIWKE